jgi:hypothetical protein
LVAYWNLLLPEVPSSVILSGGPRRFPSAERALLFVAFEDDCPNSQRMNLICFRPDERNSYSPKISGVLSRQTGGVISPWTQ